MTARVAYITYIRPLQGNVLFKSFLFLCLSVRLNFLNVFSNIIFLPSPLINS